MNKKTKQQFDLINQKLDTLLGDTAKKAQKYDNYVKQLKKLDVHVKQISNFREDNGSFGLSIAVEIPVINVHFDDNNEVVKCEELIALNELRLLNTKDMQRISESLTETSFKNKIGR